MSGKSISQGWVVLGVFLIQKKQKTFQMKKTQLGKITGFMRNTSLIFLLLRPEASQQQGLRNTIATDNLFLSKNLKELF